MGDKSDAKERRDEQDKLKKDKYREGLIERERVRAETERLQAERARLKIEKRVQKAKDAGFKVLPIHRMEVACPAGAARLARYRASKCMEHPIIQELMKKQPVAAQEYRHGSDWLQFDGKKYLVADDATEQNELLLLCASKLKEILAAQQVGYLGCRNCQYYKGEIETNLGMWI